SDFEHVWPNRTTRWPKNAGDAGGALVRESGAQIACRWVWGGDFCTTLKSPPHYHTIYCSDVRVGILGGRDEDGRLLIIHCASRYNNTVITGLVGFTAIVRHRCFAG